MSLHALATRMAAQGRNGDSMLVHMTPGEVGGLQALAKAHGGSLSVNPSTGLPEASFLKSKLPTLVGAALTATGVGAPIAAAGGALAGAAVNKDDRLGGALMGAMGGWGGAGLAKGLQGAAGASAAADAAAQQAAQAQAANTAAQQSAQAMGGQLGDAMITNVARVPDVALAARSAAPMANASMGQGLQALANTHGRQGFMDAVGGMRGLASKGYMAAAPMVAGLGSSPPRERDGSVGSHERPYHYQRGLADFSGNPFDSREHNYFPNARMTALPVQRMQGGGMVRGPGDGMSDSIPAVVDGGQPVRLTNEEFVVPADVVSGLGNGSSSAGARRLYEMMERVRQQRTGRQRQPGAIDPNRVMPA